MSSLVISRWHRGQITREGRDIVGDAPERTREDALGAAQAELFEDTDDGEVQIDAEDGSVIRDDRRAPPAVQSP